MNESGQNFDELKKLLKLKRHELPPPGFFNHFSDEIVSRIRDGEARGQGPIVDRLNDSAPWLVNFLRFFEAKPGVIGAFATSLCLLLVFGVVLAERSESGPQNPFTATTSDQSATTTTVAAAAPPSMVGQFASVAGANEGGITISTNGSLQPVATLFGQPGASSLFQPASFAPGH
jgi:hypothetical protein